MDFMEIQDFILTGKHIRLEPLSQRHRDGLSAA